MDTLNFLDLQEVRYLGFHAVVYFLNLYDITLKCLTTPPPNEYLSQSSQNIHINITGNITELLLQ